MGSPFNPLDWLKSAQDWFSRTERSSGFRPFLIFLVMVNGMTITLLSLFQDLAIRAVALGIMSISDVAFIVLTFIKAFTDPNFCRSESHIERLRKIDREVLGSDTKQIEVRNVGAPLIIEPTPETSALPSHPEQEGEP